MLPQRAGATSMPPGQVMMAPGPVALMTNNPNSAGGPELFLQGADGTMNRAGTMMTTVPDGVCGSSPRIQATSGGVAPTLLHKAAFGPMPCDCCIPADVKKRRYVRKLSLAPSLIRADVAVQAVCRCISRTTKSNTITRLLLPAVSRAARNLSQTTRGPSTLIALQCGRA